MRSFAVALALVVVLVLPACQSRQEKRCQAAIDHTQDLDGKRSDQRSAIVEKCVEMKWSDAAVDCLMSATSPADGEKCLLLIDAKATNQHWLVDAKMQVMAYASYGYSAWAEANPGKACPAKLADLSKYTTTTGESEATTDKWGNELQMTCAGAKIRVTSAGPDGKLGTSDDITWP